MLRILSHFPSAGPLSGGTSITVVGEAFQSYGAGALCVINRGDTHLASFRATVTNESTLECVTTAEAASMATGGAVTGDGSLHLGVSFHGDPNAQIFAEASEERSWYFADMSAVAIQALQPLGAPLRGGTTLVVAVSNHDTLCAGATCPDPPLCVFERLASAVNTAPPSSLSREARSPDPSPSPRLSPTSTPPPALPRPPQTFPDLPEPPQTFPDLPRPTLDPPMTHP